MKSYFEEMVRFERWSNETLLGWLESHSEVPDLTKNFAHLIAENHPWLFLLKGQDVPEDVNPEPTWTLAECRENLASTMDDLEQFVASCSDEEFANVIQSVTPTGKVYEHTVRETLIHLFNHAEHHRGQMLQIIAEETGEYVPSLYMSWLRRADRCA